MSIIMILMRNNFNIQFIFAQNYITYFIIKSIISGKIYKIKMGG